MAAHDSSWEIFRSELKRWMELRRTTNRGLAEAVNADLDAAGLAFPVDEQIIKRWRHSTAPPLMALKVIARILGMSGDDTGRAPYDPTYLLRVMGILDTAPEDAELIEAAYRLQTLRAKIAEAQTTLATVTADDGAVDIVRAATASGLGVAVLPVFEGPRGYPMHVSDRIDLRDADDATHAPDVADHPLVSDALHDVFAVHSSRTPRFTSPAPPEAGPALTGWAVQHVGCPRTSVVHRPHSGLPAVSIVSVTTTSWPDDIGDLLAMVLGYGFTTTRELARELVSDPYAAESLRSEIHSNFLAAATPLQRVWTHHGVALSTVNEMAPFRDGQGRVARQLVQVYLREDDDALRRWATSPPGPPHERSEEQIEAALAQAVEVRDALDARFDALRDDPRMLRLPVSFLRDPEDRWGQVFAAALRVLHRIEQLGVTPVLDEVHERLLRSEPHVAPQILRWFADHDAPFVDARYRTEH